MERVIGYIDGFNLYFGMKEKAWQEVLWLDVYKLIEGMIKPGQTLVAVNYFTSRVAKHPAKQKRQNTYLDALIAQKQVALHFGHFQAQTETCRNCGHSYAYASEKMTDVNIATCMLSDAFAHKFDTAILVSGDSDLVPPVKAIHNHFKDRKVVVAFPPERYTKSVAQAANGSFIIGKKMLKDAQLPEQIVTASGYRLLRPEEWQ